MSGAAGATSRRPRGHRGRALGTTLHVLVTRPETLAPARAAVDTVVADIDRACSRFRDDSEISRLQARAGERVRISPLLHRALSAALRAAELTGGAVDPTVGTAVKAIGYEGDFATVARDGAALHVVARRVPGWRCLQLDRVTPSALVPRGVELDLGSTAKALAADLAAQAACAAAHGAGVLVNLGGDIAVAGEPPDTGWVVQVSESSAARIVAGAEAVAIRTGGMATSSTTIRRWRRGGVEMHHIVDPATGRPAGGPWRTVTCVAGSCLDANIAATAAVVRGEGAVRWLEQRAIPSRLVGRDGRVVRTAGWPRAA